MRALGEGADEGQDLGHGAALGDLAHDGGLDDAAIGDPGDGFRGLGRLDAEADDHRQFRLCLDPGHLGGDIAGRRSAAPVIPVIET